MQLSEISVGKVDVSAYTIPTDAPEGDGTLRWDSTTLIVCEVRAANQTGLGYSYGNEATASVVDKLAGKCLLQRSALDIPALHSSMLKHVRNDGSRGVTAMAISALDIALWDLKAKLLRISVVDLFGTAQSSVAAYGSGGFTTYSNQHLASQLSGWIAEGLRSVKMKIGAEPTADVERVRAARAANRGPRLNFLSMPTGHTTREGPLRLRRGLRSSMLPGSKNPSVPTILRGCDESRSSPGRDGDRRWRVWLRFLLLPAHA